MSSLSSAIIPFGQTRALVLWSWFSEKFGRENRTRQSRSLAATRMSGTLSSTMTKSTGLESRYAPSMQVLRTYLLVVEALTAKLLVGCQ